MTAHRHPRRVPPAAPRPINRRTVLRGGFGLGALALGGTVLGGTVLSACGDDGGQTSEATGNLPQNALLAAFPQGVPHAASGVATRLPYLLADKEGVPLSTIDGPVTFRVEMDGTQIGDEVEVEPRDDGVPRAYLPLTFTFPRTGVYDVFATYDGAELDSSIQIYDRAEIGPPVVGAPLPAAPTPTTELGLAVNPICTRVPQCPFHAVDLQAAVGQAKPIVLMVATPAYCQTAVCGPILDNLVDEVGDRTDITVIHAEVYKNPKDVRDLADANLAPLPEAYNLRFEPVMFVTDASGMLVARADITVDRTEMRELLALAK